MSVNVAQVRTAIADRPQLWPQAAEPPELLGIADGTQTIFTLRFENYIPGTLTIYEATPPAAGSGAAPSWTAVSTVPPVLVGTTSTTAVSAPGAATVTPASMANIATDVELLVDQPPNQEVVRVTGAGPSTYDAIYALAHEVGFTIAGAPAYQVGSPNATDTVTLASNATITFAKPPTAGTMIGARYQATAFSDADLSDYLTRALTVASDDITVLKRVQYDIIDIVLMDYERLLLLSQGDYRKDPASYAASLRALKVSLRLDLAGGPVAGANVPAMAIGTQTTGRYQPLR
jgi:hypothetical protein